MGSTICREPTWPVGVRGGEVNVGVGSRVDSAEAPVSPRSSSPSPLDLRRGRGIAIGASCKLKKGLRSGKNHKIYREQKGQ